MDSRPWLTHVVASRLFTAWFEGSSLPEQSNQGKRQRKVVFEPKHSIWTFFALLIFFFVAWYFAHWGGIAAWLTLGFSLVAYLFISYDLLKWSLEPHELDKKIEQSLEEGEDVFNVYAVTIPFSFCGFFALASFSIFMIWSQGAYPNGQEGFLPWVQYLADNLFRAVMFDFAETFYIDISKIEHANVFLLCLLVFSFRTIAGIGLLSLVLRAAKKVVHRMSQD